MKNHRAQILLVAAIIAGFPAATFAQGSLTPSGPPGSNMVTLAQVRPRTPIFSLPYAITNAGSYQLMTNIVATAGVSNGITIAANDVSLDLNGFSLHGAGLGTRSGIAVPAVRTRITIRNGAISGWLYSGIDATNASACIIENVRVTRCNRDGISVGPNSTVRSCTAVSNALTATYSGFRLGRGSTIMRCFAGANISASATGTGITLGDDCTAVANTASGSNVGFFTGTGNVIRCCTASQNYRGIVVGDACEITRNVCSNHDANYQSAGILLQGVRSWVSENTVSGGDLTWWGIVIDDGLSSAKDNVIARNVARGCVINYNDAYGNNDIGPVGTADTATSPFANF